MHTFAPTLVLLFVAAAAGGCAAEFVSDDSSPEADPVEPAPSEEEPSLLPLVPGATFTYSDRSTNGETHTLTKELRSGPDSQVISEVAADDELVARNAFTRIDGSFVMVSMTGFGTDFEFHTECESPELYLPEEPVVGNLYSWAATCASSYVYADPGADSDVIESDRAVELTVVGWEEVEVPAGRFEALRVDKATEGGSVHLQWFAPDVGLIKVAVPTEVGDNLTELVSYEIP